MGVHQDNVISIMARTWPLGGGGVMLYLIWCNAFPWVLGVPPGSYSPLLSVKLADASTRSPVLCVDVP